MFAFNQTIQRKIDPKTHVNLLDSLLQQLRKRADVVYLKRLTIVLDEESEKGFGLVRSVAYLFLTHLMCSIIADERQHCALRRL